MKREDLEHIIPAAGDVLGESEAIIVRSQTILAAQSMVEPALSLSARQEAFQRIPRMSAVYPEQIREDRLRIVPSPLAPGTQAQPVQGSVERPVIDKSARQHAVELSRK